MGMWRFFICQLSIAKSVKIMQKLTKSEKMWLIFFALILIGLIGGCMYETVSNHKPIGPRPIRKEQM